MTGSAETSRRSGVPLGGIRRTFRDRTLVAMAREHVDPGQVGLALVLGAAGDIGVAICRRAVAAGWDVLGVDIAVPEESPGFAWRHLQMDLSRAESLDQVSNLVRNEQPNVVICALGAPAVANIEEILHSNFITPVTILNEVMKAILPGAAITVVSSVSSSLPSDARSRMKEIFEDPKRILALPSVISASRSDAYALAKGLLREWVLRRSSDNVGRIRLNVASPISTKGRRQSDYELSAPPGAVARGRRILGRDVSPEDVASAVEVLTLIPEYWWLNGTNLRVDGGLMNHLSRSRDGR